MYKIVCKMYNTNLLSYKRETFVSQFANDKSMFPMLIENGCKLQLGMALTLHLFGGTHPTLSL